VDLEAFELVLLRTPESAPAKAPAYDDAELERIQREHLAYQCPSGQPRAGGSWVGGHHCPFGQK
jgi:hypothetical protein